MTNAYQPLGGTSGIPGLDPQTAAIIQYLLQQGQMGGGFGAGLDQASFGYDPTQYQSDMLNYMPMPTADDMEDPLGYAKSMANYQQDRNDLMTSPEMFLAGGAGTYSQDAFAPEVTMELIPRPETIKFQQYATQGDESFEGWIAQRVIAGKTPRQAITELREIYDAGQGQDADEDQKAAAERVARWLPSDPQAITPGPDWTRAFDDATSLATPFLDEQALQIGPIGPTYDQQTGQMLSSGGEIVEGADGQLYRQTTTPSPLAEQMREMGFSNPNENYTAADLLGSTWQQAASEYEAQAPAMEQAYRDLLAQSAREKQAGPEQAPQGMLGGWGTEPVSGQYQAQSGGGGEAQAGMVEALPMGASVASDELAAALQTDDPTAVDAWLDDHLNLTNEQYRQIRDAQSSYAEQFSTLTPERSALVQRLNDMVEETTGPNAVTQEQMDTTAQAAANATGGAGPLTDYWDTVRSPTEMREYLENNWTFMTPEQRDEMNDWVKSQRTSSNATDFEEWDKVWQATTTLRDATEVADWNAAIESGGTDTGVALPEGTQPAFNRNDLAALVAGGGDITRSGGAPQSRGKRIAGASKRMPTGGNPPPGPIVPPEATPPTGFVRNQPAGAAPTTDPAMQRAMLQAILGGATGAGAQPQAAGPAAPTPPAAGPAAQMPWDQPVNADLPWNQAPAPAPSAPRPGAPTISQNPDRTMTAGMQAMIPYLLGAGVPSVPHQGAAPGVAGAAPENSPLEPWLGMTPLAGGIAGIPGYIAGGDVTGGVSPNLNGAAPEAPSPIAAATLAASGTQNRSQAMREAMMRAVAGGAAAGGRPNGLSPGQQPWDQWLGQQQIAQSGRGNESGVGAQESDPGGWGDWYNRQVLAQSGRGNESGVGAQRPASNLRFGGSGRGNESGVGAQRPARNGRQITTSQTRRPEARWHVLERQANSARQKQEVLRNSVYGVGYSKARAMEDFLKERGITPFSVQWATRSGALQRTGLA